MKATKPPRETVSSLNYRDAEGTPTATAPVLHDLAGAALRLLARDGVVEQSGQNAGDRTWRVEAEAGDGFVYTVTCTGPDLPDGIPDETAHPSSIPFDRPWVGTHRLVVRAPLVALDLYWRADAPLRIMTFSRGDWERELTKLAA